MLPQKITTFLKHVSRSSDLPSIDELSRKHLEILNISEPKYFRTSDPQTLKIAQKIVESNKFLRDNILGIPQTREKELESQVVMISDISNYPKEEKIYRKWLSTNKSRLISIGGPSATDQALLSLLIPSIRQNNEIHFYLRNYLQSNSNHSAKQSLARHSPAMYSDPNTTGHKLLPIVLKRLLFNLTVEDILEPGFTKIDVKLNSLRSLLLYAKSQINWFREMIKEKRGQTSEHDVNRIESILSQQIMRVIQHQSNLQLTTNKTGKHMSIQLALDKHTDQQIVAEQECLKRVKEITWQRLDLSDIFPDIYSAWGFSGDCSVKYDVYDLEKKKAIELGGIWKENKTLKKVFVKKSEKSIAQVCGVLFEDGMFVPSNKIHLSLGYRAKYVYEGQQQFSSLKSYNTVSTGVSTCLLLQNTPKMSKLLSLNDGAFELMGTGSHWTYVAHDEDNILVRGTAGGNTGAEGYMPSYFLNLLINSRRIFGQALIGVVSAYGCSRAVNFKNSTQFCQIAKGLLVSYGKGGTGHTKRSAEAVIALNLLGLGPQIQQYFDSVQVTNALARPRLNISKTIKNICYELEKSGMYYPQKDKTSRFLNK